jgi:hypothetical protein
VRVVVQAFGVLGLALLVTATPAAATPDRAARLTQLTETLDALVALERPDGGWTYEQGQGVHPTPSTWPLRIAEGIAGPLGLATWDTVVLRSPGTPAAGLVLLDAYTLTGRAAYLEAARRAGDVVLAAQLRSGGWFSEAPMEGDALAPWFALSVRRASLDDDVTPGAVRLMVALWQRTGTRRYWYAALRGAALLRAAQLPSGAWPLIWRPAWKRALIPTFEDRAALNDGATSLAIETLLVAGAALERADLVRAAKRGGDWLIAARRPPPYAGWAQQYDTQGHPAHARRFEPPALATWESRYAMEALLALAAATGDRRYCAPLAEAAAWLVRAAIAPGCWARFYDLETGVPLYVDDAGRHVAAPAAAHQPYDWQGDFGVGALLRRLDAAPKAGTGRGDAVVVRPIAGDRVRCPEAGAVRPDARASGDPRLVLAQAARLLAALQPPPAHPCR